MIYTYMRTLYNRYTSITIYPSMILGSHNSMSYLAPAHWWMWPFRIFVRCQKKTIREQFFSGVKCFDLRVSFDSHGRARFSHGLVDFILPAAFTNGTSLPDPVHNPVLCVLDLLDTFAVGDNIIYVRFILEKKKSQGDFDRFYKLCKYVEETYRHLSFIGGVYKKTWERIYDFNDTITETEIAQPIGSMAPDARWYERLIPAIYALRHNSKATITPPTEKILLCDFV